jgi:glycerol uptake facilitator-like aquaporin
MLRPKQLKQYSAQCLAEFFGTFIFVFVGNLSVAQAKLSTPPVADSFGVNLAFATGIYLGIMVAGPISGKVQKKTIQMM